LDEFAVDRAIKGRIASVLLLEARLGAKEDGETRRKDEALDFFVQGLDQGAFWRRGRLHEKILTCWGRGQQLVTLPTPRARYRRKYVSLAQILDPPLTNTSERHGAVRGFWGLVFAQFLGAFNDNALRSFLIALTMKKLPDRDQVSLVIALATWLFLIPYLF